MKVTTKFDVRDIVKMGHEIDKKDMLHALDIMEVQSVTCYGGTQTFYICRPIIIAKNYENKYDESSKSYFSIHHGFGEGEQSTGWKKYREDELIKAPKKILDILKVN